jgi:hypothetical protein
LSFPYFVSVSAEFFRCRGVSPKGRERDRAVADDDAEAGTRIALGKADRFHGPVLTEVSSGAARRLGRLCSAFGTGMSTPAALSLLSFDRSLPPRLWGVYRNTAKPERWRVTALR